jgi:hypothetical protein
VLASGRLGAPIRPAGIDDIGLAIESIEVRNQRASGHCDAHRAGEEPDSDKPFEDATAPRALEPRLGWAKKGKHDDS